MIDIPVNRGLQGILEAMGRLPSQFPEDVGVIHGVTTVVSGPVLDVGDQALRLSENAQDAFDDLDVRDVVIAAEVIDFAGFALSKDGVNAGAVVHDIDPIADVQAIAVNGEGFVFECGADHEGDKLFGELIGAEVIGAPCRDGIQSMRMAGGADHEVGAGLGGGVGVVGLERCLLGKGAAGSETSIDLVGGYLQEALDFMFAGGVEQELGAEDIGIDEGTGPHVQAAVNVAFGGEVDQDVDGVVAEDLADITGGGDVSVDEGIAGVILDIRQVFQVAGIR